MPELITRNRLFPPDRNISAHSVKWTRDVERSGSLEGLTA